MLQHAPHPNIRRDRTPRPINYSTDGSPWKTATMLPAANNPTDSQRPERMPLGPSDSAPLNMGPTDCPRPNTTVNAAITAVHACGLAALRANAVTAATTERKEPPNRMADR